MPPAHKAWLREFNSLGLQLRPDAAKLVTNFLLQCEDPTRMVELLVENTKSYFKSQHGAIATIVDAEVINTVLSCMLEAGKQGASPAAEEAMAVSGVATLGLGRGYYVYNVLTDVKPFEYRRASKEWIPCLERPQLFPGPLMKSKVFADRYQILWNRMLMEGKVVPEAEAEGNVLLPDQRVITPVESLVGNPGRKLTFGLLCRTHGDIERKWAIEDVHGCFPVELHVETSDHLITDGSFVLAEGERKGDVFHVDRLDVPAAVTRKETDEQDDVPHQVFGGSLTKDQLDTLRGEEEASGGGMYVVLNEVHLDSVRVLEKLGVLFEGYETSTPPIAYVFMGSFSSQPFKPDSEGVKNYRDGFERLKFMMKSLPNHVEAGTQFIFIPGPKDPGAQTLPRTPLPNYLTSDLAKDIPGVIMTTNPCRVRHFSREMVFFRHDVLRLLRRHEVVPLRGPDGAPPSPEHVRNEMVQLLLDQAHLVPLPLEESNVMWTFDHTLRLYPLPQAVFVGGTSRPFDCEYVKTSFCSLGPFSRDASFYCFHPIIGELEPCEVPDRAG